MRKAFRDSETQRLRDSEIQWFRGAIVAFILISGAILLSGCGATVEPGTVCNELPTGERDCGIGGRITYPFMNSLPGDRSEPMVLSGFDAALITVDLSSSTMPMVSNSGFATVKVTLDNNTVHSSSFQWIRSGNDLYAANPHQINSWLDQFGDSIVRIDVDANIIANSIPGPNMFVSEFRYGGSLQAGSSYSWYESGGGSCGGSCQQH